MGSEGDNAAPGLLPNSSDEAGAAERRQRDEMTIEHEGLGAPHNIRYRVVDWREDNNKTRTTRG